MTGMKIYNSLVVAGVIYLSSRLAIDMRLRYWYFVPAMILFSPFYGVHIFSGLTEFTYSLILVGAIYACYKEKYVLACVLTAFLPFARNEGVLPIMLMAIYLLFSKQWRYIPWLATGHVVVGLLGWIVTDLPIHWTLTTETYDPDGSPYAAGEFMTFIKHLRFVMDWPNVILVITGLIAMIGVIVKYFQKDRVATLWLILFYGNFLGFYLGHAILHELGRYGSMGLPRVLHAVVPLAALIGVYGWSQLFAPHRRWVRLLAVMPLIIIMIYPFTPRDKSYIWSLSALDIPENDLVDSDITPIIDSLGVDQDLLFFNAPYYAVATGKNVLDQLDGTPYMNPDKLRRTPAGSIYLWDHWYSVMEGKITKDLLVSQGYNEIDCTHVTYWKGTFEFCAYLKE